MQIAKAKLQINGIDLFATIPVQGDTRLEFQTKGEYDLWSLKDSFNQILEYYKVRIDKINKTFSFESSGNQYLIKTVPHILKHYYEPDSASKRP